jgi:DNA-binding GntR family transcriptional regulator
MNILIDLDQSASTATDTDQTDAVYVRLRKAILNGNVPVGQPVSQVKLAKELGVSRTPLREALRMLQSEGLIESEHNRRIVVRELKVSELDQIYGMRITLETLAARITIQQVDDAILQRMTRLLQIMSEKLPFSNNDDYDSYESHHRAFHHEIISRSGDRLVKTIGELHDHADRYRRYYYMQGLFKPLDIRGEHAALLDACVKRDPDLLAARLARHYAVTVLGLIARLEPTYDPAATRTAARQAASDIAS